MNPVDLASGPTPVPALRVEHLSKIYAGTRALHDVSLEIQPGEVRALAGGNGSGKSTLIKILAGVVTPDSGASFSVFGSDEASHLTPPQAHGRGLRFVHQDPGVFDELTIAENLAFGARFSTASHGHVSRRRLNAWAQGVISRVGITVPVETRLGRLSQGTKMMVSIARAVGDGLDGAQRLLVLDEATAALADNECAAVFEVVRRAAALGHAVMFVTHRLEEVLEHSDSVTVLRDGVEVVTRPTAGLNQPELIETMLGRRIANVFPEMPAVVGRETIVSVRGLAAGPLMDVDLDVRHGEILGVAGLLGSGRTTLLKTLFGELTPRSGTVQLRGLDFRPSGPAQAMRAGVAYVPEDRLAEAAYSGFSVSANLSAAVNKEFHRGLWFARGAEQAANRDLVKRFSIKTASIGTSMAALSGGNQQKVVLARWMRRAPALLLLDEPTQGVDVGARADIYGYVREAVAQGAAVIVVASDLEELARVSDRVIVLRRGAVAATVEGPSLTAGLLEELTHTSTTSREAYVDA